MAANEVLDLDEKFDQLNLFRVKAEKALENPEVYQVLSQLGQNLASPPPGWGKVISTAIPFLPGKTFLTNYNFKAGPVNITGVTATEVLQAYHLERTISFEQAFNSALDCLPGIIQPQQLSPIPPTVQLWDANREAEIALFAKATLLEGGTYYRITVLLYDRFQQRPFEGSWKINAKLGNEELPITYPGLHRAEVNTLVEAGRLRNLQLIYKLM